MDAMEVSLKEPEPAVAKAPSGEAEKMTVDISGIGEERLKADIRQYGGLILALGICAMFGALVDIAIPVDGVKGTTPTSGVPLWILIAGCCQAMFGCIAIVTGYLSIVADKGYKWLTGLLIVTIQLAWMPYITKMTGIGKNARSGLEMQTLVPGIYDPSQGDVNFVASMGIIGIFAHGFVYIGSLAFMAFSLYAYQTGNASDRCAKYFHGRFLPYCLAIVLAGFTQLSLGSYALAKFSDGPMPEPLNVAMYTIFYPEISVYVGLVQLLVGFFGVARYFGIGVGGKDDNSFQFATFFMWLMMMVLQIVVQVAYAPGPMFAAAAPTRACIFFAFGFFPAFLDFKMRTAPEVFEPGYYGADYGGNFEVNKELHDEEEASENDLEA